MEDVATIMEELNSLQKDSYKSLIDVAVKLTTEKSVKFQVLNNFITSRLQRLTALYDLVDENYQGEDMLTDYTVFQDIIEGISGDSDELDVLNGMISQIVFGDVRTQRWRKREIAELSTRQDKFVGSVINNFSTFKKSAEELKGKIPEE